MKFAGLSKGQGTALLSARLQLLIGSFALAGANLLVALFSARTLGASDYGKVAFILVVVQFQLGLVNALIITPITSSGLRGVKREIVPGITAVATTIAIFNAVVAVSIAFALKLSVVESLIFACFAAVQSMRWAGRGVPLAENKQHRVFLADSVQATCIVCGITILFLISDKKLTSLAWVLLGASLMSSIILPPLDLRSKALQLFQYHATWKAQARWSLLGVVSSEAVANGFSYIVVALTGPTAFAPLAFASLFWRPFSICVSSLTPFERNAAASELRHFEKRTPRTIRRFFFVLLSFSIITIAAGALIVPHAVRRFASVDGSSAAIAFASLSAAYVVKAAREPLGVLWQAEGKFRALSLANLIAGVGSLLVALVICALGATLYAPLAVAVSEFSLTLYLFTRRASRE